MVLKPVIFGKVEEHSKSDEVTKLEVLRQGVLY